MGKLEETARLLVAEPKGILAADWGVSSIGKRFEKIGLENTPENRRQYREMLFGAPGLGEYISGVIENEETLEQGLAEVLKKQGILPGVKVDRGLVDMANFPGEKVTVGLDGLRERLIEYKKLGAEFCKWRAVIKIGKGMPTDECIRENARILSRYAALCQEQGLVPIVEPEVVREGDHSIEKCAEVTERELKILFGALAEAKIIFEGLILKTNMVTAGEDNKNQAELTVMAASTMEVLRRSVPVEIPGVVFLSGGQDTITASKDLNEIVKIKSNAPWQMTFSYERAFEEPMLMAWAGRDENREKAWEVLIHRAKMNSLARLGQYTQEAENAI